MFKHLIPSILIASAAAIMLLAGNARAESVTFELSVYLPPHVNTAVTNNKTQNIQQQLAMRHNTPVLLKSVVVL